MDPSSSPYIIPNNSPYHPFPHSLLSTREKMWVSFLRAPRTKDYSFPSSILSLPPKNHMPNILYYIPQWGVFNIREMGIHLRGRGL